MNSFKYYIKNSHYRCAAPNSNLFARKVCYFSAKHHLKSVNINTTVLLTIATIRFIRETRKKNSKNKNVQLSKKSSQIKKIRCTYHSNATVKNVSICFMKKILFCLRQQLYLFKLIWKHAEEKKIHREYLLNFLIKWEWKCWTVFFWIKTNSIAKLKYFMVSFSFCGQIHMDSQHSKP